MKKIFSLLIMGLLLISMVSAVVTDVADNEVEKRNIDGGREPRIDSEDKNVPNNGAQNMTQDKKQEQLQTMQQNGTLGEDAEKNQEREQEKTKEKAMEKVKIGEKEIDSEVEVETDEEGNMKATMSNGNKKSIKVMPSQASEKAIQALSLHNCREEDGCTIELKEVGNGNETKAAYEIKTQKQVKVLGLFKAKMQVQAQVDAENGEVLKTKKAWWSFLASEEEVEEEQPAEEIEQEADDTEPLTGMPPSDEPTVEEVSDAREILA